MKSVREILLERGYIVTDKCLQSWQKSNRLITDLQGNEIGYFKPLEALKKLK